jgi:dTMP kinase
MVYTITFEGGEGAGKGTQIQLLKCRLEALGKKVYCAYEPGTTYIGEMCRALVKGKFDSQKQADFFKQHPQLEKQMRDFKASDPLTQMYLFAAARSDLFHEVAQKNPDIFIDDRSIDSTVVYQGFAQNPELIPIIKSQNTLIQKVTGITVDKTIYLDIPVTVGLSRAAVRKGKEITADWFESQDNTFHQKVRKGYLQLVNEYPQRISLVETVTSNGYEKKPEEIHEEIFGLIRQYI